MPTIADDRDLILKKDCDKYMSSLNNRMDKFEEKLNDFKIDVIKEIAAIPENLEKKFVGREEFYPIKSIVYGMVGFVLLEVLRTITALIINK